MKDLDKVIKKLLNNRTCIKDLCCASQMYDRYSGQYDTYDILVIFINN